MLLGSLRSPQSAPRSATQRSSPRQHSRGDSWEFLESKNRSQRSKNGHTASEMTASPRSNPIYPLQETADRVGKEVERFAEKLDRWNSNRGSDKFKHQVGTLAFVDDLRKISDSAAKRLAKVHGAEQEQELKEKWWKEFQSHTDEGPDEESLDLARNSSNDDIPRSQSTLADLRHWRAEAETWKLVHSLLDHRYQWSLEGAQGLKEDMLAELGTLNYYTSDTEVYRRFLIEDDIAQEHHIVRKWLEETAEITGRDIDHMTELLEQRAGKGPGLWSSGCLYTRERIKGEKRLRRLAGPLEASMHDISNSSKTGSLITNLDPDARTRQGRDMEPPDDDLERSLWFIVWHMLRRGKGSETIRTWCRDHKESWRAVSVGAVLALEDAVTNLGNFGSSALWRRVCFLAGGYDDDEYESAVYGLLSGDIDSVDRVCSSWDDVLYAHVNSSLLARFDRYLISQSPPRVPTQLALRPGPWNQGLDLTQSTDGFAVAKLLNTHTGSKSESQLPIKLIQGSIITDTVDNLLFDLGQAVAQRAWTHGQKSKFIPRVDATVDQSLLDMAGDYNAIRICTHLYISHLHIKKVSSDRAAILQNVVAAYIDFLRLAGKFDIIPLYASVMTKDRAQVIVGRALLDMKVQKDQIEQIRLMEQYKLDTISVLKEQLQSAISDSGLLEGSLEKFKRFQMLEPTEEPRYPSHRLKYDFVGREIAGEEEAIIRSLEWYLIISGHWEVTFESLARVYRLFLLHGRVDAALALSKRMPFKAISFSKTLELFGREVDVMEDYEGSDNDAAPGLGRSTRSRSRRRSATNSRPLTPEQVKIHRGLLKQQSRTAYELEQLVSVIRILNQWAKTERELDELDDALEGKADASSKRKERLASARRLLDDVQEAVEPLLHDFLTRGNDDKECSELEAIRCAYLPEIVLAYNSAVHVSYNMLPYGAELPQIKCMDLATVIAAEENEELADAFVKTGRMNELVTALALSSALMLEHFQETKERERAGTNPKTIKKSSKKSAKSDKIWLLGAVN